MLVYLENLFAISKMQKPFLAAILSGIILSGFFSCKKDSGVPAPAESSVGPSSFLIASHPNDPLFGIARYENGNQVHFFGQKDSSGNPLKVRAVMTIIGKDSTWIFTNDDGKINTIRPQNGCEFSIDWQEGGLAIVTARPNDSTELQSEFTFSQRPGKGGLFPWSEGYAIQPGLRSAVKVQSEQPVCEVNLIKCGTPVLQNYNVTVIAQDNEGKNLGTFPAINTGGGVYQAMIPRGLAPVFDLKQKCQILSDLLEISCAVMEVPTLSEFICTGLSSAALASGIAAPVTGVIFAGCISAAKAMEWTCLSMNSTGISSKICNADFIDQGIKYDMVVFATTPGYTNSIASPKVSVPNGYQALPVLTIPLPAKTKLDYLKISPSKPLYRDYFTLKCGMSCLPPGGKVKVIAKTALNTGMLNPYSVEIEYNVPDNGEAFAEIPVFCARKAVGPFCLDVTILASGGGQESFGYHLHRDIQ